MKQIPSDKYTIAWFKLAECISRGEKERALGVYRLLSHSIEDAALVCQLEGDIFFSFNDNKEAIIHYYQAAQLYKKDNRLLESAAVYEHLLAIQPDNKRYRTIVINLYNELAIQSKIKEHVCLLVDQLRDGDGDYLENMMKKIDPSIRDIVAKIYHDKNKR
ncbi:MAG: hypothetical protein WCD44_01580 [Candidatus Babeliales bacterium]